MTATEMKHLATVEKWKEIIQECRRDGRGVKKWCAEHGISFGTYYRWEREIFKRASETGSTMTPRFAEVPAVAVSERREAVVSRERKSATIRLEFATIDIYPGADKETIRTLMTVLSHAE